MMMPATINHILTRTEEHQLLQRLATGEINAFWQIFQQHRDYLFRCCLKWMNGNSTEAEDLLSQAMVKAWEKAQKFAGKIENFKSWLTTLTRNFWIDLTRHRGANQVEDIEIYGDRDQLGLVSVEDTPAIALDRDEKKRVICRAIDELPSKMRETFILHFYEEFSHQEISEKQEISYQNVCKRISQARAILALELRGYFVGEDGTKTELAVTSAVTEPAIEELSEGNGGVEAIVGEPVTLSVAIGEVEGVGGDESPFVALSEQHSESDSVAATADEKLEVRRDGCRCVEVALGERELAPILANGKIGEERGERKIDQKTSEQEIWERQLGVIKCKQFHRSIRMLSMVKRIGMILIGCLTIVLTIGMKAEALPLADSACVEVTPQQQIRIRNSASQDVQVHYCQLIPENKVVRGAGFVIEMEAQFETTTPSLMSNAKELRLCRSLAVPSTRVTLEVEPAFKEAQPIDCILLRNMIA